MTFIDNSKLIGLMSTWGVRTIAVQNGYRALSHFRGVTSFDVYLGFDNNAKAIIDSLRIATATYQESGPYYLGNALQTFCKDGVFPEEYRKDCEFVLVSQYREGIWLRHDEIFAYKKAFYTILAEFCRKRGIKVLVVGVLGSETERDFFQKIFGEVHIFVWDRLASLFSYRVALGAKKIVGFHSTLCYELGMVGKSVFFGGFCCDRVRQDFSVSLGSNVAILESLDDFEFEFQRFLEGNLERNLIADLSETSHKNAITNIYQGAIV